ncbi:MAG: glycosyltransferase [Hyphomicrobiaceae bacterium]
MLLVAATDYDSSVAKGVDRLLHDFDDKGFFDKVVMIFPFTRHNRVVALGRGLVIHEFGIPGPSLLRRTLGPFHVLRVIVATARLANRETVAAVRATDPCLSGFVSLLAARLAGKPFCVSIHADFDRRHERDSVSGAPRVFGSRRLAIALERIVLSRADMVLPIRESLIGYATSPGAPRTRISVLPHGADLSAFTTPAAPEALAGLGLPDGRPIVSFVGRLSRENYVDDVLEAARHLAASSHDTVLIMAGGDSWSARLRETVSEDADLSRVVRFLGSQPRPVVAALKQASAVALCPMGGFRLIEACAGGARSGRTPRPSRRRACCCSL